MKIIQQSSMLLKPIDIFKLTLSPTILKVSEHEGNNINVKDWLIFEDADKKAETTGVVTILSIMGTDGQVYATNSQTFTDMFNNIQSIMGEESFTIKVVGGESKAGRHYITCDLVME